MIGVYAFSGAGHSMAIAQWLATQYHSMVMPMTTDETVTVQTAIVVFPVYCQNLPTVVASFLKRLRATYVVLIATYGRIAHGNVLWEATRQTKATVIAAAYVPMGHTYLGEGVAFDAAQLTPILDRIAHPRAATLKKEKKSFWANILPSWRSRVGVEIMRTDACDRCGFCRQQCAMNAIEDGKINSCCIRCMHCVLNCPRQALQWRVRPMLERYLRRERQDALVLYL